MNKILKKATWLLVAAMTIGATSCEDFDKMNRDPNSVTPEKVKPMQLFTPWVVSSTYSADSWQRMTNLTTDHYAQYFVNEPKYENQTGQVNDSWITDYYWNYYYTWFLNMNEVIRICDPSYGENRNNIQQAARIWRVWIASRHTDYFGDVPYFKACDGSGESAPYDKQEDIYMDFFKQLDLAINSMKVTGYDEFEGGDVIFNGSVDKWRQFANSLRLRLAMRLTEVAPEVAKREAAAAMASDAGFITENVTVYKARNYWSTHIGYNMFYPHPHYWEKSLAMSQSMEKILTNFGDFKVVKPSNRTEPAKPYTEWTSAAAPKADWYKDSIPSVADPRALIMFDVTSAGTLAGFQRKKVNGKWSYQADFRGRWSGIRAGLSVTEANKLEYTCSNHSRLGAYFVTPQKPEPYLVAADIPSEDDLVAAEERQQILMYANEVHFLKAEAALRGYISGDAKTFYEEGVRASMASYNVGKTRISNQVVSAYLSSKSKNLMGTSPSFNDSEGGDTDETNPNSKLFKIIVQKYLAGFPEASGEAYNDYRRLGIPALDPMPGLVPTAVKEVGAWDWKGSVRRLTYPAVENDLNRKNVKEAIDRMGGQDLTSNRMWWDARQSVVSAK